MKASILFFFPISVHIPMIFYSVFGILVILKKQVVGWTYNVTNIFKDYRTNYESTAAETWVILCAQWSIFNMQSSSSIFRSLWKYYIRFSIKLHITCVIHFKFYCELCWIAFIFQYLSTQHHLYKFHYKREI